MHRLALEAAAEAEAQLRSRILDLETQLEAEQEVGQGCLFGRLAGAGKHVA